MSIFKHLLAIILAIGMVFFGAQKFGAENHIFQIIADRSGIDLFEPLIRKFTGVMEIIAGLLLLVPATRGFGALMATGIVGGAIGFHLSPWLGIHVPAGPGLDANIGLFTTAIVIFILALINLAINRKSIPVIGAKL